MNRHPIQKDKQIVGSSRASDHWDGFSDYEIDSISRRQDPLPRMMRRREAPRQDRAAVVRERGY